MKKPVPENPWQLIMLKHLTGGAPLSSEEAVDMIFPITPEERAMEEIEKSWIKENRTKPRTWDELYMQKVMRDRMRNVG